MSLSEEDVYVKTCATCAEIMPRFEKVCYCGGPIKLVKVKKDKAQATDSYFHRKWLYRRKKCGY